jgi:chemosensory pili system protein ChpC
MLIPLQKSYLLLPNSVIAEVVPKTRLTPEHKTDQNWLSHIDWQQQSIPLVYLEKLLSPDNSEQETSGKFCILKSLNQDNQMSHYAISCQGTPQLITLNQTALHVANNGHHSPYLHSEIIISNTTALIPNLDHLEATLTTAF